MPEANKYETSFTIHEKGAITGEPFDGAFKVKTRLSFRDQLRRDEVRRQYLGQSPNGTQASEAAASTAIIFGELAVRIVDAPSWWKNANAGVDLFDDNVLVAVYQAALKAESDELEKLTGAGDKAKADLAAQKPVPAAE